ncbi:cysteine-rich receptor-like protein kinase 29 [Carya illinoinensis]|uniref:cysteine-rich receptor-like protein kinase 29 n=1 Tax=Carya illinoinensis TaxID=32201 RepID=UPI001C71A744|nr:cysteine-rich receptor-like protein kinase 29 [Carya illinoinensis]
MIVPILVTLAVTVRAYRKNVNTLLSSLSSNTQIDYGFYNFSTGENLDRVIAFAPCRADLTPTNCRSCISVAAIELLFRCPNQEGTMWYMNCTVRYSNNSIFGVMKFKPVQQLSTTLEVTDPNGTFDRVRETLLDRLRSEAAASASTLRKFATGSASSPYFDICALLQCAPDLNQQECSDCRNQINIATIPTCCATAAEARVLTPSCNLRYENRLFYGSIQAPPLSSSTFSPPAEGKALPIYLCMSSSYLFSSRKMICLQAVEITMKINIFRK